MISAKYHTIRLSMQLVLAGVGLMGIGAVLGPVASAAEAPVQDAALPAISRSLHQHPDVTAANARVCQVIHRLGLSWAQSRPQISLSITGGRQLLERMKGQNGRPDRRGGGRERVSYYSSLNPYRQAAWCQWSNGDQHDYDA